MAFAPLLADLGAAGEKRLGYSGSLPVRGRGRPVVRCLLTVLVFVAVRGRRQPLVRDGATLVRLGCLQEAMNAAGECLLRAGLGVGRVLLRLHQLLAGACQDSAFQGQLQLIEAYADGGDTVPDLLTAALPAPGLVLHISSMPTAGGCVTAVGWPAPTLRAGRADP